MSLVYQAFVPCDVDEAKILINGNTLDRERILEKKQGYYVFKMNYDEEYFAKKLYPFSLVLCIAEHGVDFHSPHGSWLIPVNVPLGFLAGLQNEGQRECSVFPREKTALCYGISYYECSVSDYLEPFIFFRDCKIESEKKTLGELFVGTKYENLIVDLTDDYVESIKKKKMITINPTISVRSEETDAKTFWTDKNVSLSNKSTKMEKKSLFSSYLNTWKNQYIPQIEDDLAITINGDVCKKADDGSYIGIGSDDTLTSYPVDAIIDFPVYSLIKPLSKIKVGDIIRPLHQKDLYKVIGHTPDGNIRVLSIDGCSTDRVETKEFMFKEGFERVILSFKGLMNGDGTNGMNPMLLMLLLQKDDKSNDNSSSFDKLLPLIMMQKQNGEGNGFNPLMLLALKDGSTSKLSDLLLLQAMGGQMLGDIFNFGSKQPEPAVVKEAEAKE